MPSRQGSLTHTGHGDSAMTSRAVRILIHYGEIALKGRNRPEFEKALQRNVRRRLEALGLAWPVSRTHDRVCVDVEPAPEGAVEEAVEALAGVPGVVWLAAAAWLPAAQTRQRGDAPDYGLIEREIVTLAGRSWREDAAFAVRVNRADKRALVSSHELERRFGAAVIRETRWRRVDLGAPDTTLYVDVYPEGVYVHARRVRGVGGLPVGTTGRVLALLSGGIDSPVAAWLAAKRGCAVDFIHFTATAMQQSRAEEYKVTRIARDLSRYTLRSRLYLVPYDHFDVAMLRGRTRYELILFRRFMAAVAQRLAAQLGALALVSGDSLGQVASQTLENLVSNSRAVHIPILRPLITYDKQEIVDLARRIGTFEASIEPYKDCCAIIGRHPKTLSEHQALSAIEAELLPQYDALVEATIADAAVLEFDCGTAVKSPADGGTGSRSAALDG